MVNLEVMCLDRPRVHGLHYIFTAGMGCQPAKPLPSDLETFVSGAKGGIIVVSFGSALKGATQQVLIKMLEAFSRLDQRVVMRHRGEMPNDIPSNVVLMKWLPQNDLLGHSYTKLFITHAGNNGQLEALYHGVPMLSMPVYGDQMSNAERSRQRGYGLTLDIHTFTSDELQNSIVEMLQNPSYRRAIQDCSARYRHLPTSQDRVTFWVEHIIKFGGDHLKPVNMDMPLWRFFMLDVLLVVLLVLLMLYSCLLLACCKCQCRCRGRKGNKRKAKAKTKTE